MHEGEGQGKGLGALVIAVSALAMGLVPVAGGAPERSATSGRYIVTLSPGANPAAHALEAGIAVEHSYKHVFRGYSAQLSQTQLNSLLKDGAVESVERSRIFRGDSAAATSVSPKKGGVSQKELTPQVPSVTVVRVGALESPTAKIDGIDERVNVDIAIIDSGIQHNHPDLNVRGGTNCVGGANRANTGGWKDKTDGHGTLVAGIAAAIDNGYGRVGIAPGARLWAVNVLDSEGLTEEADVICALEWLVSSGNDIEVANMSLSGAGENIQDCHGSDPETWDALQRAICAAIAANVTLVASAGNEGFDASTELPAAYPDVIAVSAFGETDGRPGGLGQSTGALGCEVDVADDTFAFFPNFGPVVDLSSPGVCVGTTYLKGTYAGGVGTSFSTPFVAGAAGLYLATHPNATPAEVMNALVALREPGPIAGDPDGIDEGIVDVSGL
jgi:subtilisin family serine protease